MMRRAGLAALALALAACGGTSTAAPAPAAGQLARRLPGCYAPFTPPGGISVDAATEQECITGSAEVFVATFASASLERSWLTAQRGNACGSVEGNGWAASVLPTTADAACQAEAGVAHALGGRLVSG